MTTGQTRVLSVYEGFFTGGARVLHSDVLSGLHGRRGQHHSVLSIHGEMRRESTFQPMGEDACYRRLVADGLEVATLGRAAEDHSPFDDAELAAAGRLAAQADVVLTLKEQPLRLVNRAELSGRPVIACLHRSDPQNQGEALGELRAAAEAGRLAAAVCCAESARDAYADAGIPEGLLHVIPNGVDLRRFKPNRKARSAVRATAGIPADAPVVVFAARYDGMKNVPLFLAAAQEFLDRRPDGHILMCGAGMTSANPGLLRDLGALGLAAVDVAAGPGPTGRARRAAAAAAAGAGGIHLLGVRSDPEAVYAAADVVALTSAFGEAAPLCLIEGMLCGAVPVATDVGDCAAIVAGHGLITEPQAAAVAQGWIEALDRRTHFRLAVSGNRHRFGRARMIGSYGSLIHAHARGQRAARRTATVLDGASSLAGGSIGVVTPSTSPLTIAVGAGVSMVTAAPVAVAAQLMPSQTGLTSTAPMLR